MGSPFYDAWSVLKQGANPLTSGRPVDFSGAPEAGRTKLGVGPNQTHVSGPPSMEKISPQQRINLDLHSQRNTAPSANHWADRERKFNSNDNWGFADNPPNEEKNQRYLDSSFGSGTQAEGEGFRGDTYGQENYKSHVGVQDAANRSANQSVASFLGEDLPEGGIPFQTNHENQFLQPEGAEGWDVGRSSGPRQSGMINEILPQQADFQPQKMGGRIGQSFDEQFNPPMQQPQNPMQQTPAQIPLPPPVAVQQPMQPQ